MPHGLSWAASEQRRQLVAEAEAIDSLLNPLVFNAGCYLHGTMDRDPRYWWFHDVYPDSASEDSGEQQQYKDAAGRR